MPATPEFYISTPRTVEETHPYIIALLNQALQDIYDNGTTSRTLRFLSLPFGAASTAQELHEIIMVRDGDFLTVGTARFFVGNLTQTAIVAIILPVVAVALAPMIGTASAIGVGTVVGLTGGVILWENFAGPALNEALAYFNMAPTKVEIVNSAGVASSGILYPDGLQGHGLTELEAVKTLVGRANHEAPVKPEVGSRANIYVNKVLVTSYDILQPNVTELIAQTLGVTAEAVGNWSGAETGSGQSAINKDVLAPYFDQFTILQTSAKIALKLPVGSATTSGTITIALPKSAIIIDGKMVNIEPGAAVVAAFGSTGVDHLDLGSFGKVYAYGGLGADNIRAGNGNDVLWGDIANNASLGEIDEIFGGQGKDWIFGGGGGDQLYGENGEDYIYGHDGDDVINGGIGKDNLTGGLGQDTIRGGENDDVIVAGSDVPGENDAGQNFLYGDAGNDTIHGALGADTIVGGFDKDTLFGGDGADDLTGGNRSNGPLNDQYYRAWNDGVSDRLSGGAGSDTYNISGFEGQHGPFVPLTSRDFSYYKNSLSLVDIVKDSDGNGNLNVWYQWTGSSYFSISYAGEWSGPTNINDVLVWGKDNNTMAALIEVMEEGQPHQYLVVMAVYPYRDVLFAIKDFESGSFGIDLSSVPVAPDGNNGDDDEWRGGGGDDDLEAGDGSDTVFGEAGSDTISGGSGSDFLDGGSGNDFVSGNGDNDELFGQTGDDHLDGGQGEDHLDGGAGSDILEGGQGDDFMGGGSENDTYVFNQGDGSDVISEFGNAADIDTIVFGADITASDVTVSVSGRNVNLTIGANGDSIYLSNQLLGSEYGIETIEFSNGVTWTSTILQDLILAAQITAGDDYVLGTVWDDVVNLGDGSDFVMGGLGNDVLHGGSGSDTLMGEDGSDTLQGGLDADQLNGGSGNDVYVFNIGDGADQISDSGSLEDVDILMFGAGIAAEDVTISGVGSDVILLIGSNGDSIQLSGQMWSKAQAVEEFHFSNGVVWAAEAIAAQLIAAQITDGDDVISGSGFNDIISADDGNDTVYGGEGDDLVYGNSGNDMLEGGSGSDALQGGGGDDYLSGQQGDDIYAFELGDGSDQVADFGNSDDLDAVVFGSGINAADVTIARDNDDVILTIGTNGDSIRMLGQLSSAWQAIEEIRFANNTLWTGQAIREQLIAAEITSGDDSIMGTGFNDTIAAGTGNDIIDGGYGDDILLGGGGNDYITDGDGANVMDGGAGDDVLSSSSFHTDRFIFSDDFGHDTVEGFDVFSYYSDVIGFGNTISGFSSFAHILAASQQDGSDVLITIDSERSIRIQEANLGDLQEHNFKFAAVEVTGTEGADTLSGTSGADTLRGLGGDDVLDGGADTDILDGGAGVDTAIGYGVGWTVLFQDGKWTVTDGTTTDNLQGIEKVVIEGVSYLLVDQLGANIGGFQSVQSAVDAAASGDVVLLASGEFNENLSINGKSLTLDGAGRSGASATTLNGQITVAGVLNGALTLQDLAVDATGRQYGVFVSASSDLLVGEVTLDNVLVSNAGVNGFAYIRAGNGSTPVLTDTIGAVSILNSEFLGNATQATGSNGRGDVLLYGFNGDLTLDRVSIHDAGVGAQKAIQLRGLQNAGDTAGVGPYSAAGTVTLSTLTITGAYLQDLMAFYRIASFESFTVNDVDIDVSAPWGVLNLDSVGGVIDLSTGLTAQNASGLITVQQGLATADTMVGTNSNDLLDGRDGADSLDGGAGNDIFVISNVGFHDSGETINGGADLDVIRFTSTTADQTLVLTSTISNVEKIEISNAAGAATGTTALNLDASAVAGDYSLTGNNGANTLTAGTGSNTIVAGGGNDILIGGSGDDSLTGGAGNDTFVFAANSGHDLIADFTAGAGVGDVIQFHDGIFADFAAVQAASAQVGADVQITLDASNSILLKNVSVANLNQDDFYLV